MVILIIEAIEQLLSVLKLKNLGSFSKRVGQSAAVPLNVVRRDAWLVYSTKGCGGDGLVR